MRWLSKCICLLESGKVAAVPDTMWESLHMHRSFAYAKLKRWAEAEEDADVALSTGSKAEERPAVTDKRRRKKKDKKPG